MHPIILITLIVIGPAFLCGLYFIARELNLTHAIDPEDEEINYSTDNSEFDAEVQDLINSRKTKN